MSNLLVVHNGSSDISSREEVLDQLTGWNIRYLNADRLTVQSLIALIRQNDFYFLIISKEVSPSITNDLINLRRNLPLLSIIYYDSQLKDQEFSKLYLAGVDYCFIGDARQLNLLKKLQELWQNHWRRIPQELKNYSDSGNTVRRESIIAYMETCPLRLLTTTELAKHQNISESRFRIEFKRNFGLNFREFKQRLFYKFESYLLFEKQLKPSEVFNILGYTNLSAFSRSFKTRHGYSWQYFMRKESQKISQDKV